MKAKAETVRIKIQRFDPTKDIETRYDSFDVQTRPGMTVLDALFHVLEKKDSLLAFRYSCRSAVCGSCTMFINGRQRLACNTQIASLGNEVTIGPLPHLPVIRDMVVDLRQFFAKIDKVKPYIATKEPYPEKEFIQIPTDREAIDVAIDCIDCAACFSACPITWTDEDYPGPAALVKAARFIADTRDIALKERLRSVGCEDGVWRCHTIFNCEEACPKKINPTHFIQYMKRKAVQNLTLG